MKRTPFAATVSVNNVNEALPLGLQLLKDIGVPAESRNGNVIRAPGPVMTVYDAPCRRVLFDQQRDANPFFHLIESLWILAGSNRKELPCHFLESYGQFAEADGTLHGAYGFRARHAFGVDQLKDAIQMLRNNRSTRQCVISLWDPCRDLGSKKLDIPCNDMIMFDIVDDYLNMTVCNRSNDAIWGAYGANAVHFSFLQEYVAVMVGAEVGKYVQMSNNFHVYDWNPFWHKFLAGEHAFGHVSNPYMNDVGYRAIAHTAKEAALLMMDAVHLCERAEMGRPLTAGVYVSPFMTEVVHPMIVAYEAWKRKDYAAALDACYTVAAPDWQLACAEWVMRRMERAAVAAKKAGAL